MNNPDHISESLETNFWVKILKFLMRIRDGKNFGSGMEKIRLQDPGSGINIPDPQHWKIAIFKFNHTLADTW